MKKPMHADAGTPPGAAPANTGAVSTVNARMANTRPVLAVLMTACLLLLGAHPGAAQEVRLEAESFSDSGDLSQPPIKGVDNPACSGGVSLVGLDCAGEWTAYDALAVPAPGTYSVSVHYRAETGRPVLLRLSLSLEGNPARGGEASTAAAAAASGSRSPQEIELSLRGDGFG
jgi:hypothetical protein